MPIDYSKWDNLDEYSSSDDEGQNDTLGTSNNTPQVTTLNGPSRVSFGGGNGSKVLVEPSMLEESATSKDAVNSASVVSSPDTFNAVPVKPSLTETTSVTSNPTSVPPAWTDRGGSLVTLHADKPRRLVWSQDRYSVQIRLELFSNEKVAQVFLQNVSSYQDRHCATGGGTSPRLQISCRSAATENLTILNEELPHPIHWAQEDDDGASEGNTDWTVEVDPQQTRFVLVSLYKAVPMQGIFIWWKRPLLCFPEMKSTTEPTASQSSFLKAWEEAHDIFRQSKKDKTSS